MIEKSYYLKYYDITVAELFVRDNIPFSMEIYRPELFFDKFSKTIIMGDELTKWIKNRIRPDTQNGFDKILERLKIDDKNSMWYFEFFLKTRGLNVKDRLFITDNEFEESPWDTILTVDDDIKTVTRFQDLLNVNFTDNTKINTIGACKKTIVRVNGNLAIMKKSLQDNTYDAIAEELVYFIAERLGVKCSPAKYIGEFTCVSFIDESINLIHAGDFLDTEEVNVEIIYKRLLRKNIDKRVKIDLLRMFLLDILTRQVDRNVTNFGFYNINEYVKLYRMYDNGLSLFAGSRYNESLSFRTCYGESMETLSFIVRQLKKEGIKKAFPGDLDSEFLYKVFEPYREEIYSIKGNSIDDIIAWVIKMYENISKMF
ncbi:MAG: hypothetical protein ACRCWM_08180 [Sarcina sp.]